MNKQPKTARRRSNAHKPERAPAMLGQAVSDASQVVDNQSAKLSKPALIKSLLKTSNGANLAELVEVTGWQAHSIRATMTGLRKQGLTTTKTKAEGGTRFAIVAGETHDEHEEDGR